MSTQLLDELLSATDARKFFTATSEKDITKQYQKIARQIHPDGFTSDNDKFKATEAFKVLNKFYNSVSSKNATSKANVVKTRRHEYIIGKTIGSDDITTTFDATYDAGHKRARVIIANSVRDADLISQSVSALRKLHADVPEEYRAFFPSFIESFRYRQDDGDHAGFVIEAIDGFYTLEDVHKAYPGGISGRDVAWMFRRMLVAIGNAHEVGLVHAASTAAAFLIHPQAHGLILNDWHFSVNTKQPLVAVPAKYKTLYPQSTLDKNPVDATLDICLSAKTASSLLTSDAPTPLKTFFKGCCISSVPPAAELLAEFDELLLRVYGKPRFSEFKMP